MPIQLPPCQLFFLDSGSYLPLFSHRSCHLEDEKPLHKMEAERAAEEATQLALVEEEASRNQELVSKYGSIGSKVVKPFDDVTKGLRKTFKKK